MKDSSSHHNDFKKSGKIKTTYYGSAGKYELGEIDILVSKVDQTCWVSIEEIKANLPKEDK